MAAITWRNVTGADDNGALRNLLAASQGVGNAFGGLQQVVNNFEAADRANLERTRADNTDTFLDQLQARYTTPEALQAAIQSGEVDQLRAGYGKNIDRNATRGAAEARLTNLRQAGLSERQFNNQVAQDEANPLMQRAKALALQGDLAGAQALTEQVDPRFQGTAAQGVFDANRSRVGFDQDQTRFQWAGNEEVRKGEQHKSTLATQAAQREASAAASATSRANTALTQLKTQEYKDDRTAQNAVNNIANAYQLENQRQRKAIDEIARQNESMLGKVGKTFDPSKVDSEAGLEAFEALLKTKGLSLDAYTNDTKAHQDAVMALRAAGASPKAIANAMQGTALFDTSTPARIGNDAEATELALRRQKVNEENTIKQLGGLPTYTEDGSSVIQEAAKLGGKGDNSQAITQGIAQYYSSKGTVNKNGERVYLPKEEIIRIAAGRDKQWFNKGLIPGNTWAESIAATLRDAEKKRSGELKEASDLLTKQQRRKGDPK